MRQYETPAQRLREEQLRDFLYACAASTPAEEADRLVEAADLLAPLSGSDRFWAMMACKAYESAALLVLGPDRPFLISRGGGGVCLATSVYADGEDEATTQGATPALALLAAHAAAVLADEGRGAPPVRQNASAQGARLH